MGFFRNQQIAAVKRLLRWQYEKKGLAAPAENDLDRQATAVVDRANQIARRTGRNVLVIARDLLRDLGEKGPRA